MQTPIILILSSYVLTFLAVIFFLKKKKKLSPLGEGKVAQKAIPVTERAEEEEG